MTDATPLLELGLVLFTAALLGAVARRCGLPAIVAYLLVGLAAGPFTPGHVVDRHQLELLADVGVILLLFEVGIELDVRALRRDEPPGLLIAAPVQVVVCVAAGAGIAVASGLSLPGALTIGLATALSSSVVVVNMSRSRKRTLDDRTGRTLVVWAVLQDAVSLLAVALLAALLDPSGGGIGIALARLALFAIVASLAHVFVVPRLLAAVRAEGDSFLIIAVSVALLTAAAGAVFFGVPVALAAFVAGLALSADPTAQEARREVIPFRDLFAVLFFVAIGTLVDPAAILANWQWFGLGLALVVLKSLIATGLAVVARLQVRPLQLGVGLGQIGEFSFVVLGLGVAAGAISGGIFSAVLAAAVVTIALSAIAVRLFAVDGGRAGAGTAGPGRTV
ncbi:MAG TPA: cation:proton antiporter [Candidatus Limnocylindria bacterium]|nr:cation:proton antiporter [Candidatus Limnocylindria bacterium]